MEADNIKAKKRRLKPQTEEMEVDEDTDVDQQIVEETDAKGKKKHRRRHKSAKQRLRLETDQDSGVGLELGSTSVTAQKSEETLPVIEDTGLSIPAAKKKRRKKGKEKARDGGGDGGGEDPKVVTVDSKHWDWVSIADPGIKNHTPLFSKDGLYYFNPLGSSVDIHATSTGQVLSTLWMPNVSKKKQTQQAIAGLALNPSNEFQLLIASLEGSILVWDYMDAALLRTIKVGQPIISMCLMKGNEAVIACGKSDGSVTIYRISIQQPKTSPSSHQPTRSTSIAKIPGLTAMSLSQSESTLVAIHGATVYTVSLSNTNTNSNENVKKYPSPEALTCLAVHPSEEYFATGDKLGQIRLWYCLQSSATSTSNRSLTKMVHWHAHAVASLSFSPNGAYLLSGGEEAVLVVWDVDGAIGGRKEFIPRLGSPIDWVACIVEREKGLEYVAGLKDGTTVFVDAITNKISRTVAGLKLDPTPYNLPSATSLPLAYHSNSGTLILPSSHPSSLQIYSPSDRKLLSEVEVSPSNRVSRRDEDPIEPARVEIVRISSNGLWMVTIDSRINMLDYGGDREVLMKIWRWNSESGTWMLNTRVDEPHGERGVKDVAFMTRSDMMATIGEDGYLRLWKTYKAVIEGTAEDSWSIHSTTETRSKSPGRIAISYDDSLLAIAQGNYVTVHAGADLDVVLTIQCSQFGGQHLSFVGKKGRYLAIAGEKGVLVWDLLAASLRMHYVLKDTGSIRYLIVHPTEEIFVLAVVQPPVVEGADIKETKPQAITSLLLFRPHSPSQEPFATRSLSFDLRALSVVPPTNSRPGASPLTITAITNDWNILICGDGVKRSSLVQQEEKNSRSLTGVDTGGKRRTLFEDMFGKKAFLDLQDQPPPVAGVHEESVHQNAALNLFTLPSHSLPSISSLYNDAISAFLLPRPATPPPANIETSIENMEVDEVPAPSSRVTYRKVQQKELDSLVELFKTIPSSATTSKTMTNGNGVHKPPKKSLLNTTLTLSSKAVNGNHALPPPGDSVTSASSSSPSPSTSPPPALGTKRKNK